MQEVEDEEFMEDEDDGWEDGDGEPCPTCGKLYRCCAVGRLVPFSLWTARLQIK